jgi:hypothetical protein
MPMGSTSGHGERTRLRRRFGHVREDGIDLGAKIIVVAALGREEAAALRRLEIAGAEEECFDASVSLGIHWSLSSGADFHASILVRTYGRTQARNRARS